MKRKRILITGITGFCGSHLADYLLSIKDGEIWGLKRPTSRLRHVHHILDEVKWFDGDLNDPLNMKLLIRKSKPDRIYHLAALSWVSPSWGMPSLYMQTNAIGTINLLEAVRDSGFSPRILISCTPEEFGDVKPEDLPITEKSLLAPANPYAASKVAQDAVCQSYFHSYGMEVIRTLAFNHEGPRRDILGGLASFAYQIALIEAGLQKPVVKVGNLSAKRNFTDVRDMARAYYLAMEKGKPGELYLIGSDQIYTIKECLKKLISLSPLKEKIQYQVEPERVRPTELHYQIGDISKFYRLTGWKPTIPFEKTLQDILDYWREFIKKQRY